jgi:recombination protein RecA
MDRELSVLEKSLMQNINKQFGDDNPMIQLKNDAEYGKPRGWVDTGIYALNWIISGDINGGWPVGRIAELDGDPGTGKSLLCEMAMRDPTIDLIIYFDTEAAMNTDFLTFLGVDIEKVLYQPIDTVEQLQAVCSEVLNTIIANKQTNKKILMIIDSIALASTEKEMDPEKGSDMGYKARKLREFFRVYARKIERYNVALLVTNHYTQVIGKMYGPSKTTTGGTALPYAASVRIDLKIEELDVDKKLEAVGASSVTLRATTMKNRCFSPRRRIFFVLDFERGVHRYSGLLKVLENLGVATKNKGWYSLPSWDPDKSFYAKDFPDLVEQNKLQDLVQSLLIEAVRRDDDETKEVAAEFESEALEEAIEKAEAAAAEKKKTRSKKS